MKAVIRESLYNTLARTSGVTLVVLCVLFQRRGLLDWSELVFLGLCIGLQEAFVRLPKLKRLRTPMLVLYSMLPLALVLYHFREIHDKHGDFVQMVLYTPLPLVLVSVQIMVLYVRESARLVSVVLVLALFSTVIGVRRPLDDSVWPWLAGIGVCASVFLMLQHPGMLYQGVYVTRRRATLPPSGRPGGIIRGAFFSVMPMFTTLVLLTSIFLYFALPRFEAGGKQQGYEVGADPGGTDGGRTPPDFPDQPHDTPGHHTPNDPDDNQPASVSGLSKGVDLGDFGEIKRSTTPALDVKLVAPDGDFVQRVHLRAFTYGKFDGMHWTPIDPAATSLHEISEGESRRLIGAPLHSGSAWVTRRYKITLREAGVSAGGQLPVPAEPQAIHDLTGMLYYDKLSNTVRAPLVKPGQAFEVDVNELIASQSQLRRGLGGTGPSLPPRLEYLQVPPSLKEQIKARFKFYDRYRVMAEGDDLHARPSDRGVYACASDLVKMFREATAGDGKAWVYSLDFRPKPGPDAIARFLDTNTKNAERFGHCEYFASAMCVLLRCYGVPARVAAGFLATNPDQDGVFQVTGASAHAWVEVYIDRLGWVAFDPTPPESDNVANGNNPLDKPDAQVDKNNPNSPKDAANTPQTPQRDWFRKFDRDAQAQLFNDIGGFVKRQTAKLENALSSLTSWMPDGLFPKSAIVRAMLLVLFPVVAVAVLMWRRRKRRKIERKVLRQMGEGGRKRQRGLYFQLLLLLARYGFQKRASETPREFACRVVRKGGAQHKSILELTEIYYALRFGLDGELEGDFKRALAKYSDALRSASSAKPGQARPA